MPGIQNERLVLVWVSAAVHAPQAARPETEAAETQRLAGGEDPGQLSAGISAAQNPRGVNQRLAHARPALGGAGPGPGGVGAGPGSPRRGAERGPGTPARSRAPLVGGNHRSPGHEGVRPPSSPALPAATRPIRAAFTGEWAELAQLLGGSGMVTSPCGGGRAWGGPTAPPAARAGGWGTGRPPGVPGTPGRPRGVRGEEGKLRRGMGWGFGGEGVGEAMMELGVYGGLRPEAEGDGSCWDWVSRREGRSEEGWVYGKRSRKKRQERRLPGCKGGGGDRIFPSGLFGVPHAHPPDPGLVLFGRSRCPFGPLGDSLIFLSFVRPCLLR